MAPSVRAGDHFVDRAISAAPATEPPATEPLIGSLEAAAQTLSAAARWLASAAARWRAVERAVDGAAARGGAVALGPVAVDAGALRRLAGAALAWAMAATEPPARSAVV